MFQEFAVDTLIMWAAIMMGAGILGGLIAGLLGVGGGIVVVPVLYNLMAAAGVDDSVRILLAVSTSMAAIVPTAFFSARSHHKRGAVDFGLLKVWAPTILVGTVAGSYFATQVNSAVLTIVFAVVALLVAADMILRPSGNAVFKGFLNGFVKGVVGFFVGGFSAMMGIGGGTLSVPILSAVGFPTHRAVGTAAAIGLIVSIPATAVYLSQGWDNEALPPLTFGFVNLLGLAFVAPMSALMAPRGAALAHSISGKTLRLLFGLFLLVTAGRMFYDLLG
ncbi:MAG: sulfite exporter TauE/SafE family protein [Alphaproteobacteria bacterium]|nr:sulfite exporter TauE/SafE family protein [Alphaproteobacteria bacterium]